MVRRLLMAFLLLSVAVFATNVNNAHYEGTASDLYLETDMQFTTDFTLSVDPNYVVSGDPSDLQSGDTVCTGAQVTVDPTVNAKWATPDFDAVAIYPVCGGGYCPAMIDYSTVNTNRNVRWLIQSIWDDHYTFGTTNDFSQSQTRYNELAASSFATQSMTYTDIVNVYHDNKEGGAGVFCKGTLQAIDGSTVVSSHTMPTSQDLTFTISGAGTHQVGTRLSNVECFGVVVKHPIDLPNQPSWFWLDYFVNNGPSIPTTMATDTISLNVGGGSATCNFHEAGVTSSGSFVQDRSMIRVTMCNDGPGSINISDVSSDNSCYGVVPAPEGPTVCGILGLPSSLCPASNGFDEQIADGACKDVYVHVIRTCTTGCPALTFTADSSQGGVCGGTGTGCGTEVVSLCNDMFCEIEPPALDLGTQEVGDFGVTCYDIGNNVVPCGGNNWFWSSLNGGFVERTSTHALAYTTDPPGSSGQLWYDSNTGLAVCYADVDVIDSNTRPIYTCEFDPPSAHVEVGDSEYFNMTCYLDGVETTPDDATYTLIDGLSGSTSDETTDGTTYNAPNTPDSGTLQGYGEYTVSPYVVGAIALAPINVINTTGNGSNGGGNNGGGGDTQYCAIGDGSMNVFPGDSHWVDIWCGPNHNETCQSVSWDVDEGYYWNPSVHGTMFTVTGQPGMSGQVTAVVNGDPDQICWMNFFIGIPDCWEFT